MSDRCIITYAAEAHEELLDISLPTYRAFADKHGYDLQVGKRLTDLPAAWNKVFLLLDAVYKYKVVVWFDCDLIVVDINEDFPALAEGCSHSLVRHFDDFSEVPNSGVWRVTLAAAPLLERILDLQVFRDHGWWEQAALMTQMGYTVPPQGSVFPKTRCKCVNPTRWHKECQFLRIQWNNHPNYRSDRPKIVHCSYPNMLQRIEVMRELVKNPQFNYPRYNKDGDEVNSKPIQHS